MSAMCSIQTHNLPSYLIFFSLMRKVNNSLSIIHG